MAGSTQIGSASLVLSASADGLVGGLQQAERRVQGFGLSLLRLKNKVTSSGLFRGLFGTAEYDGVTSEYLGRVGGLVNRVKGLFKIGAEGGGGGLVKSLLLGAAGGAGLGLLTQLPGLLASLPESMGRLARNASAADAGGLAAIARSAVRIGQLFEQAAGKVISKFGPAFVLAQDWVERLSARAGPLLDSLGAKLGTVAAIAVETFGQAADAVAGWAAEMVNTDAAVGGASKNIFNAFRQVAAAAAAAWEAIRPGAGIITVVGSFAVSAIGLWVEAIGGLITAMDRLDRALPAHRRLFGDGVLDGVGGDIAGIGADIAGLGEDMRAWGLEAVRGIGTAAAPVAAWVDEIEKKVNRVARSIPGVQMPRQLAAALKRDSVEAYSVVTKYANGAAVGGDDLAKRQLKAIEKGNELLRDVLKAIGTGPLLRGI